MAAYTDVRSKRATLSTTTADTVTLSAWDSYVKLLVTNESSDQLLSFTIDGSTPTQGSDDAYHVPAGKTLEVDLGTSSGSRVVTVVGNGNTYIVQIV